MKSDDQLKESPLDEERSFYRRWSERKLETTPPVVEEPTEEPFQPADEDMPSVESLDEHSDYQGFLSPKVSDQLRQLALRKLFHSASFNICDGLDDYAEDFTQFEALGDVITADLRHRLEVEAKRQEAEEQELADEKATQVASSDASRDDATTEVSSEREASEITLADDEQQDA